MISLSLCMIVKNEEAVLARCLDCMKDIADEIIIADTGSTDSTKEIAARSNAKIYDFAWYDDFAAARNFSFEQATCDYIMWLDADDVIAETERQKLLELKRTLDPSTDVVMLKYDVAFDEEGQPTFSYYRERLLKRSCGFRWQGAVHEAITPSGKVAHADIHIRHEKMKSHDPERNLKIFEKLLANGTAFEPRQQFYYARELYYNQHFKEAKAQFSAFLQRKNGWREDKINACLHLAECHFALGDAEAGLHILLQSFAIAEPRAEICCRLGQYYFNEEDWQTAAFWYEAALLCAENRHEDGFIDLDSRGFIPHIQLCVCYDRMGEIIKAAAHNEAAGHFRPQNPAYLQNKEYFTNLGIKKTDPEGSV